MDIGTVTVADVIYALEEQGDVYLWMVLRQDKESMWYTHALLVEAFPHPSNGRFAEPFTFHYNALVACGRRTTGVQLGRWLSQGWGELENAEDTETFQFELPRPASKDAACVTRFENASHLAIGAASVPWPYTAYDVSLDALARREPDPSGPLAEHDDGPSFRDFHALVADLVFGVKRPPQILFQLSRPAIVVRIAQTTAWLEHIHLGHRAQSITVSVQGTNINDTRLEVQGPPDIQLSRKLQQAEIRSLEPGLQAAEVTIALNRPIPEELEIYLSRRGIMLDQSFPRPTYAPLAPIPTNVTTDTQEGNSPQAAGAVTSSVPSTAGVEDACDHDLAILATLRVGRDDANAYHTLILRLIAFVFGYALQGFTMEQETNEGRGRVDIMADNYAESGLFQDLKQRFQTYHIPIECKNYSTDPGNGEYNQILSRLGPQKSRFGLMTCRTIADKAAMLRRLTDRWKDQQVMILVIDDNMLRTFVDLAKHGQHAQVEAHLRRLMRAIEQGTSAYDLG